MGREPDDCGPFQFNGESSRRFIFEVINGLEIASFKTGTMKYP
ncbi:hypothetical protein HMPREF3038_03021 [Akkermansia sp. KLE1797]|nr:hypothetical protein HMPREF3038_03021 [Akkermansia sp. KLE1797]KXU53759.1 hypothetical protein HMPREF3039_02095 [Akkermansia sp. KLE1798]KZA03532.1 hypothetical protein HMPREF1326_02833 [Akkermansia sp. KLE1605]